MTAEPRRLPLWADASRIRVSCLDDSALPECVALARSRDWNPEARKWRFLFDTGEVYGVRDPRGRLVTSAVLCRSGEEFASVGMVLTAAEYEGNGLGRRTMEHVLSTVGDSLVGLYATSNGRPLYEKLGFSVVHSNTTYVGRFGGAPVPEAVRSYEPGDLNPIIDMDRTVHGADRSAVVTALPHFCDRLKVITRDGTVTGYGGAWINDSHVVIGPVVAPDLDDACSLIATLASGYADDIRLEVRADRPALAQWAAARGLRTRGVTDVMTTGGRPLPGDQDRWFTPITVALS